MPDAENTDDDATTKPESEQQSDTNNPHDAVFKAVLGQEQYAREFLEKHLPENIRKLVDLATLKRRNESHIDEQFQEYFSDLVFDLKIQNQNGQAYLLFEAKSQPDPFAELQIFNYQLRLWLQDFKQIKTQKKKHLTPIIPLLFYHGKNAWKVKPLKSLFEPDTDENLLAFVPQIQYIIHDTATLNQAALLEANITAFMQNLMRMRYLKKEDFEKGLAQFAEQFHAVLTTTNNTELLYTLLKYLFQTIPVAPHQVFKQLEAKHYQKEIEMAQTAADILRKEGMEIGLKEAEKREQQANKQARLETAQKLLEMQLPLDKVLQATGLTEADLRDAGLL